jgi:hypothetical protein
MGPTPGHAARPELQPVDDSAHLNAPAIHVDARLTASAYGYEEGSFSVPEHRPCSAG